MKKRVLAMCLGLGMLLCGCVHGGDVQVDVSGTSDVSTELGGTEDAFGESFSDAELYGHVPQKSDLTVTYVSGTKDCYTLTEDTLTFFGVTEDTVYAVSGSFVGRIVIDAGEESKFDLELCGL